MRFYKSGLVAPISNRYYRKKYAQMETCYRHPKEKAVTHKGVVLLKRYSMYPVKAGWCQECMDCGEPEYLMRQFEEENLGSVSHLVEGKVGILMRYR